MDFHDLLYSTLHGWLKPGQLESKKEIDLQILAWLSKDPKREKEFFDSLLIPIIFKFKDAFIWKITHDNNNIKNNQNIDYDRLYDFITSYMQENKTMLDSIVENGVKFLQQDSNLYKRLVKADLNNNLSETKSVINSEETINELAATKNDSESTNDNIKTPHSLWKYQPLPDEPDLHVESDVQAMELLGGLKLIGARVRGKKHKHEGTNCDDWFELNQCTGDWTIIAVSDGAGSKKFSRVGAEVACKAAVEYLSKNLRGHEIKQSHDRSYLTFERDSDNRFLARDIALVQENLHQAMQVAYAAVNEAAQKRKVSDKHYQVLGREICINDLSSTLLLLVHKTINYNNKVHSFILACQVGDGISAAIKSNGEILLLGETDSGDFSGETDFLTSKKKLEQNNIFRKTYSFFGEIRALMVMTDGVADDYFPSDLGMPRLYADLVLNKIIEYPRFDSAKVEKVKTIKLPVENYTLGEQITNDGPKNFNIGSASIFAKNINLSVEELANSPEVLLAGANDWLCDEASAEGKLRLWLDSYYVRGSFDDRTLVILYAEEIQ